jgi:redox-sensitive bicupin YhaK (pirin superfamily)
VIADTGTEVRLVVGSLYGETSAVPSFSASFYADAVLAAGARLPLPAEHVERAAYVVEGAIDVAGDRFDAGRLLVFRPGDAITITAAAPSRVVLLGGEPMDGPRYIWWNFVSSNRERIEQAKADWKAGRFPDVPGDDAFIPLPED